VKILLINHNKRGVGTYLRAIEFGRILSASGHQVDLVTCSSRALQWRVECHDAEWGGTEIVLPRFALSRFIDGHMLRAALVPILLLLRNPSTVWCFTLAHPMSAIGARFGALIGKRVLGDWDDLWSGGFADHHPWVVRKMIEFLESSSLRYVRALTCATESLRETAICALGFPAESCEVVPNGCSGYALTLINAAKRSPSPFPEKYILYIGNTVSDRLFDYIAAFGRSSLSSRCCLLLVGRFSDDEVSRINNLASDRTILVGSVEREAAMRYLAHASVMVLPMRDDGIERSRFPIRFAETIAAGVPILCDKVGVVARYVSKYKLGFIVSPDEDIEGMRAIMDSEVTLEIKDEPRFKSGCERVQDQIAWPHQTGIINHRAGHRNEPLC